MELLGKEENDSPTTLSPRDTEGLLDSHSHDNNGVWCWEGLQRQQLEWGGEPWRPRSTLLCPILHGEVLKSKLQFLRELIGNSTTISLCSNI